MECMYCREIMQVRVLLPWHAESTMTSTWSCIECAFKLGIICPLHGPHMGFGGGGHACPRCIEDQTQEYIRGRRNPTQFLALFSSEDEWRSLLRIVTAFSDVNGDPPWECVLRLLIMVAHQYNTPVEEFMTELYYHGSIRRLLCPSIPIPESLPP